MVYRRQTTRLLDWNMKQYEDEIIESSKINGEYESSNLWKIQPKSDKVHSAIFPEELCKGIIQLYSYIGDLVFDPFGESGTLGSAATQLQRFFFLTEIMPEYFTRMKEKLRNQMFQIRSNRFLELDEFATLINDNP